MNKNKQLPVADMAMSVDNTETSFLNVKNILLMLGISICYLLLSAVLVGFKPEQIFLVVLINALYFINAATRAFIKGFSIFIIYWVVFDYMKAFPNYRYGTVHIENIYRLEKNLFGITIDGIRMTINEYWLIHHNSFLDVLTGVFYLTWIPVPLAFATYLFFKNRQQFYGFALSFLLVNLVGFVIYYIYPAAPPWYMQVYGPVLDSTVKGNTAGLARFDQFFNAPVFKSIYEKSSNVFAAMPSLHSSYPVLVLYYGLRNRLGWINAVFFILMVGIWFSAVYTSHHYVVDVLVGIACALTGILLFNKLFSNIFIFSPRTR